MIIQLDLKDGKLPAKKCPNMNVSENETFPTPCLSPGFQPFGGSVEGWGTSKFEACLLVEAALGSTRQH